MAAERRPSVGCQVFVEVRRAGGDESAVPHPLQDITDLELEEIRQLKHPPETVRRIMECVHLILGDGRPVRSADGLDWHSVLRTVVRGDFLRRVRQYDVADLRQRPALVDHLCREYLSGERGLRPERVRRASRAVVAFFGWTVGLVAGALPAWPEDEVGGREARSEVERLERERVEAARRQEAARKEEAARQAARQEAARREAATQTEAKQEEEAAQERARQEEQARREEEARKAEERPAVEEPEPVEEEDEEEEEEEEEEPVFVTNMAFWDTAGNPERNFIEVDEGIVHFPSDDLVSCCNVLTREPVRRGIHLFEFVLHRVGDEQWCGVTADSTQAGMRVSGWNLRGWSYFCGNRQAEGRGQPALHVNKQVVQPFAHVCDGDVVGALLDADRRGLAFLRNGELQGTCALLPRTRAPLFLLTHVGAAGDHVELRWRPPERAPRTALEALEVLLGPTAAAN